MPLWKMINKKQAQKLLYIQDKCKYFYFVSLIAISVFKLPAFLHCRSLLADFISLVLVDLINVIVTFSFPTRSKSKPKFCFPLCKAEIISTFQI